MSTQPKFNYGGQAVIEGVMIRGREHLSLAVRRQDGSITHYSERLNTLYTGAVRRFPLLRGVVLLVETLMLGMKALNKSATMAASDIEGEPEKEISGWYLGVTLTVSLALGIGVFFLGPLFIVRWLDPMIPSDQLSNLVEGGSGSFSWWSTFGRLAGWETSSGFSRTTGLNTWPCTPTKPVCH